MHVSKNWHHLARARAVRGGLCRESKQIPGPGLCGCGFFLSLRLRRKVEGWRRGRGRVRELGEPCAPERGLCPGACLRPAVWLQAAFARCPGARGGLSTGSAPAALGGRGTPWVRSVLRPGPP